MDGFDAYKLWVAMTLHFTKKSFNVFENRGRIRCKYETFLSRPDYQQFNRIAAKFTPRDFVFYLAANLMYGNTRSVWEYSDGVANFNKYISQRQNIGHIIVDDVEKLIENNISLDNSVEIIRALTRNQITFETVVAINTVKNLTNNLRNLPQGKILEPLLMRIDKSTRFVEIPSGVEIFLKNKLDI